MTFRFGNPWLLLLLVGLIPLILWTGSRLALLTRFRRTVILVTRIVIITLLVFALARIEIVRTSDVLDVFFVIDNSDSIPEEQKQQALAFLKQETKKMKTRDRIGIVVFGRDAVVEEIPSAKLEVDKLLSAPERGGTDIGEALRLAMAALTGEHKKRIVLVSDGNENEGAAAEAAESARAHRIPIDVVPLIYEFRNDALVESVVVDSRIHVDEPFDLKVFVRADQATSARLNIFRDGELLSSQQVDIQGGKKNAFVLTSQVNEPKFHTYRVQLADVSGDRNFENNEGSAFTFAAGPPRILFVDGNPPEENKIVPILQSEEIIVDYTDADGLPEDLGSLQSYDSIIVSNVPAGDLGERRMKALEQAVHELGVGLVMIGGEHSFGAGGYQDTPVERALPVDMEVSHRKVLPRGALVVILHTCEIPQGNYWAQQIALAALNVMSKRDLMGVCYFGVPSPAAGGGPARTWGEQWLYTLQEVGDKSRMRTLIKQCQPGDMPSMSKTIQMAFTGLQQCNASVKHIVLITDADPQRPPPALVNQIASSKVTLSSVVINPHNPADGQYLAWLSMVRCGGNYYQVTNFNNLPRIFIKEASVIRKPLLCEEPFTPIAKSFSPVLTGVGENLPVLNGYVCATGKQLADVPVVSDKDDPVLAHWQYGVGKSVAFTSDAQAKWASEWLGWGNFAKFWTQLVRWTLRGQLSQNFQMRAEVDQGVGHVVVDAVDAEGNFINFLEFESSVISPNLTRETLTLRQTGPGRYETTFPIDESGGYLIRARDVDSTGPAGLITGGLALSYSPEYTDVKSNEAVLKKVADISGGRRIALDNTEIDIFDHNLPSGSKPEPLWPLALALSILLVPADVFFRRVMIDWRDVARAWQVSTGWIVRQVKRVVAARPKEREEAMESLFEAKERALEKHKEPEGPSEDFLTGLQRAKKEAHTGVLEESEQPTPAGRKPVVRKSEKEELRKPQAPAEQFTGRLLDAKKRARKKRT